MAAITEESRRCFPLQSVSSVVELFRCELSHTNNVEPNLTLLSAVAGMVENILTANRTSSTNSTEQSLGIKPIFPVIEISNIEALCDKFETQVKGSVDLSNFKSEFATRDLVKKVSDIVWGSLTRSFYKDKAHLQSLFSYLTGNKLDCFGVALAVVAACQILGYKDVHLALSEDHAWVVFGENGEQTAEVTWHGKGNEDKRGQPITTGVADNSWLYLNGHAVICTREMEVAAVVSAINPSINASSDSIELASMQQELLWLLYDLDHLKRYPLALGNLGDLESIDPTPGRPSTKQIFEEAIKTSQDNFQNHHVYPYTYLGGHLHRSRDFKGAMHYWSKASEVVSRYNYNREDEEVYKEFLEIANDFIPTITKAGAADSSREAREFVKSSECFANFLTFYDGICKWEENSTTPVLHIVWAKNFIASVTKFESKVRCRVEVSSVDSSDEEVKEGEKTTKDKDMDETTHENNSAEKDQCNGAEKMQEKSSEVAAGEETVSKEVEDINKNFLKKPKSIPKQITEKLSQNGTCAKRSLEDTEITGGEEDSFLQSELDLSGSDSGGGVLGDVNDFLSTISNGSAFPGMTIESVMKAESPAEMAFQRKLKTQLSQEGIEEAKPMKTPVPEFKPVCESPVQPIVRVVFHSFKMKGLKDILTSSEKLNTAAIHLQLTAQSQVQFSKRARSTSEYEDFGSLRRRPRRI